MAVRYSKVSVPAHLMERLTAIITSRPELGYRSASDAVTECLRRRVDELGSIAWFADSKTSIESAPAHHEIWIPVCAHCGRADERVVQIPGDSNGPAHSEKLFAHWSCRTCGARNQLPSSRWTKKA